MVILLFNCFSLIAYNNKLICLYVIKRNDLLVFVTMIFQTSSFFVFLLLLLLCGMPHFSVGKKPLISLHALFIMVLCILYTSIVRYTNLLLSLPVSDSFSYHMFSLNLNFVGCLVKEARHDFFTSG